MNAWNDGMVSTLGQVVTATLAADAGGVLGIGFRGRSSKGLHNLAWVAAGTMLAVVCLDMLPEAYGPLGPGPLCGATLLGAGLVAGMGQLAPSICPACDPGTAGAGPSLDIRAVWLVAVALCVHCTLDGVGFVAAGSLSTRHDAGLLVGLSLHKLPEGFALSLLMITAGFSRVAALAWTLVTQSFTLVGAGLILAFGASFQQATIATAVAFVAGGFLYLIVRMLVGGASSAHRQERGGIVLAASAGFLATSAIILFF